MAGLFGAAAPAAGGGGLFGGAAAPAAPAAGGMFGGGAAPAAPAAGGGLFGGAAPAAAAAPAAGGGLFGGAAVPAAAAPAAGGGLFGGAAAPAAAAPAAGGMFGGGAAAAAPAAGGGLFGGGAAPAAAAAPAVGGMFGGAAPAAAAAPAAVGGMFGGAAPAAGGAGLLGGVAGGVGQPPAQTSQDFEPVKKLLDRLESNVSTQVDEFRNQARMIEQEDDRLMANSVRLQLLSCEVQKLSIQQTDSENKYKLARARHSDIEQQLAYIRQFTMELRQKDGGAVSEPWSNTRRNEMYETAVKVGDGLRKFDSKLSATISDINRSNETLENGTDPVSIITKTLNMQLQSLKWIERQGGQIEDRVKQFQTKRGFFPKR